MYMYIFPSSSSNKLAWRANQRYRSQQPPKRAPKLDRIATELLDLTKLERHDYAILFRLKMDSNNYGLAISGLDSSGSFHKAGHLGGHESKVAEKTAFDSKLEKFDAAAKIKIIKL
ncbi:hypothetical protein Syun_011216 [Stephania yunnanensis]|uniref:Uncharacterized protein n=1 Tax=Stephania yunnanensis TaxID=152371 RepID=A0AAP0JX40_9MAGN